MIDPSTLSSICEYWQKFKLTLPLKYVVNHENTVAAPKDPKLVDKLKAKLQQIKSKNK